MPCRKCTRKAHGLDSRNARMLIPPWPLPAVSSISRRHGVLRRQQARFRVAR
ncbi:hypothetical protein ACFPRL_26350 [Pseudoclavibacter helvolus]